MRNTARQTRDNRTITVDFHDETTYFNSMIKFFVLDVPLRGVVAVSIDPAPDSAFAPSFLGRPTGQLPASHYTTPAP
jgi:hypothetical protein